MKLFEINPGFVWFANVTSTDWNDHFPDVQGLFVQDLPLKTLAALRSSQALTMKVCGCFKTPW